MKFSDEGSLKGIGKRLGVALGVSPQLVNPTKIIILYSFLEKTPQNPEPEKFFFRKVKFSEMRKAVSDILGSKNRNVAGSLKKLNEFELVKQAGFDEYQLTRNGERIVEFIHDIL